MGHFLNKLRVSLVEEASNEWVLTQPLAYYSTELMDVVRVPEGFVTDFASVPRLPLVYWLTGDVTHAAAVVHDYLYSTGLVERSVADAVFLEAMQSEGVGWLRRQSMWLAVRWFGAGRFWERG